MLLRSQDADTEQCPLDPEEYQEGLGEATLVMVPLDPVRDESGQKGGVDDVEAGPCVPWVVRDVYEREQRLLQPVRGLVSQCVSNWSLRSISAGRSRKKSTQNIVAMNRPWTPSASSILPLSSLGARASVTG